MGEESFADKFSLEEESSVGEPKLKEDGTVKKEEINNDCLSKDILLPLYQVFSANRIDYNTIKWRNVQFFTYLNATFISVTVGLLTYKNGNLDYYTKWLLAILPFSVLFISFLGCYNLKRESKLLWEQEASMFRIEKYLGVHEEITQKEKCWLMDDPYFVPKRNRNNLYEIHALKRNSGKKDLEDWLKYRWKKHRFGSIMIGVFLVQIVVAVALIYILIKS